MGMWSQDIERILENIRINSLILSKYHKNLYFYYQKQLKYFRIPVIIISALASVFNVGLQPYIDQQIISGVCCVLSLVVGIIGSLEMYLQIQKRMENELIMSKDYYLIAIDIYKVLQLGPENRNGEGVPYLEDKYTTYVKLFENSNLLEDDKIPDEMAIVPMYSAPPPARNSFMTQIDSVLKRLTPPNTPLGGRSVATSGGGGGGGGWMSSTKNIYTNSHISSAANSRTGSGEEDTIPPSPIDINIAENYENKDALFKQTTAALFPLKIPESFVEYNKMNYAPQQQQQQSGSGISTPQSHSTPMRSSKYIYNSLQRPQSQLDSIDNFTNIQTNTNTQLNSQKSDTFDKNKILKALQPLQPIHEIKKNLAYNKVHKITTVTNSENAAAESTKDETQHASATNPATNPVTKFNPNMSFMSAMTDNTE